MPLGFAILAQRNKWPHPQKSEATEMIDIIHSKALVLQKDFSPFSSILFFFFFLNKLYPQGKAQIHNPKIQSRMLSPLGQPGAPPCHQVKKFL